MRKMIERTEECVGLKPDWIAADTAYGGANNLIWLTTKRKILPLIPVFDKGDRKDGTFLRSDFTWDDKTTATSVLAAKKWCIRGASILIPPGSLQNAKRANTGPLNLIAPIAH